MVMLMTIIVIGERRGKGAANAAANAAAAAAAREATRLTGSSRVPQQRLP
jgi:hypothetical protein